MRKILIGQWCVETHETDDNIYILIPFNCEILIEPRLLGETIPVRNKFGDIIKIVLPKLCEDEDMKLISGLPFEQPTFDMLSWGTIRGVISGDKSSLNIVSISGVWCVCHIKSLEIIKTIRQDAEWLIRSLQTLSPESIYFPNFDISNLIDEPLYAYFDHKEITREGCLANVMIEFPPLKPQFVEFRQIKEVIQNYGKTINLPYELLMSAYQELHINNFRNAILTCATVIEIALKQVIQAYIETVISHDLLKQFVFKKIDGFQKIEDFLKSNGIKRHNKDVSSFMSLRNRIIHGGYIPSQEDAGKFIKLTKEVLFIYQVPHFV